MALHGDDVEAMATTRTVDVDATAVDPAVLAAESHVPSSKPGRADDLQAEQHTARKLVKTILDQGHLSPFALTTRPVLWDYASTLQLYPLPTALVLLDPEAPPFTVTYEGCHVMNPGPVLAPGRTPLARWIEYEASSRRGKIRESSF